MYPSVVDQFIWKRSVLFHMSENSTPPALVAMGILRDVVDDICESSETLSSRLDGHRRRLRAYNDILPLAGPDAIRSMMAGLTPERVAALTAALDGMDQITILTNPDEALVQRTMKELERLKKVRDHMHIALDGVVP